MALKARVDSTWRECGGLENFPEPDGVGERGVFVGPSSGTGHRVSSVDLGLIFGLV